MKKWVLLGVMLVACGQAETPEPQQLPVRSAAVVSRNGDMVQVRPLKIEVADDDHEREMGMMYRKSMADDAGMLFVWPDARERSFWMKNTYIPLDLLFVRQGKIVKILPWAKPMDESPLPSGVPADMVLEVNGGWAVRSGVSVGDTLELK